MSRFISLAALSLVAAIAATPALAKPVPAGGVTRQEVADWLVRNDMPAQIHDNGNGAVIVSSVTDGIKFDLYFYGCEAERCVSIQYAAGWSEATGVTVDDVNTWNTKNRYLRAYLSNGSNVWGEYDVDVSPGGSWEQIDESLRTFKAMVVEFKDTLGL